MTLHVLALATGYLWLALLALIALLILAYWLLVVARLAVRRVRAHRLDSLGGDDLLEHRVSPLRGGVNGRDATPGPMVPIDGTIAGIEPEDWE